MCTFFVNSCHKLLSLNVIQRLTIRIANNKALFPLSLFPNFETSVFRLKKCVVKPVDRKLFFLVGIKKKKVVSFCATIRE